MTNTWNTPVEALEFALPFRVERYEFRAGSGGAGRHRGGMGLRRDIALSCPAQITLLTDRRHGRPYGLSGGMPGRGGRNLVKSNGGWRKLPAKGTISVKAGDVVSVQTPGGGGWGSPVES